MNEKFIIGSIQAGAMTIKKVSTVLSIHDYIGAVMVRWGIKRNNYRINPGLYAVGTPESESDIFVTANYKLSFDHLRKNLEGLNGWILVLDTKGVNVWCAAGKGTFGTQELNNRISLVSLDKIVTHRRLILPQLGATGVAAHKVKAESGFSVRYGPVRAKDIKKFIETGYRATSEMRKVRFGFWDRIKLIPNDFIYGKFYLLGALLVMFLLSSIHNGDFSFGNCLMFGPSRIINIFLAYFCGIVITPSLLPYIPFRRFSIKGLVTGIIMTILLFLLKRTGSGYLENTGWFLIIPAISSFMAMNFTGSTTFTSLSGVKKEMKMAVPLQIILLSIGVILLVSRLLIKS